ncbi:hypothetical protein OH76DRAFT_1486800 [Lentinus brumalis]|uniref:Uncharacterized protein n=1 Tax=Lentinus brumalis TaxID=2498619 RepID=A0A371CWX7_9APHY|nr:hypothetical protein OH76DRAFT_1486800 [Polyporus brumalis]
MELDLTGVSIDHPMTDSFAPTSGPSNVLQQNPPHDIFDAGLLYSNDMYSIIGPGMGLGAQFIGTHFDAGQYGGTQYGGAQYGGAQYGGVVLPGTASYGNMALGGMLDTLNVSLPNINFDPIAASLLPQSLIPTSSVASLIPPTGGISHPSHRCGCAADFCNFDHH